MSEGSAKARVVLADDHMLLLEALSKLLAPEFDVVGTASDGRMLVDVVKQLKPDVVVADIAMPHLDGIRAVEAIRETLPDICVVFMTMHADPALAAQAFRIGGTAYVLKNAAGSELTRAIHDALAGNRYLSPGVAGGNIEELLDGAPAASADKQLTPRETEVVRLLVKGLAMKEVARELDITPRTVAFHKYKIMQQLGLKTNADLFQYALSHGIADQAAS